jgi:hypothetical protein
VLEMGLIYCLVSHLSYWKIFSFVFHSNINDMKYSLFIVSLFVNFFSLTAQIEVQTNAGSEANNPFAGGLNAPQFCEIDLDLDGTKDLLVFDRQGNKILPYLNAGTPNEIDYQYAPQFALFFPPLDSWIKTVDYDQDGKNDLFTFASPAGIKVYKNTSTDHLSFQQVVDPWLMSEQNGVYINILTTNFDYPAIYDLDNDGDLDILTFSVLGAWVDMHQNMSQEVYGHSDSLIFEKVSHCWGHFAESELSNLIYLDTCSYKSSKVNKNPKHTGSTFLVMQDEESGLPNIVLGDIDYPSLLFLHNTGEVEDAKIGDYTDQFPNPDNPVNLFSFPAAALVDVNNDGLKDLLISPFDSRLTTNNNDRGAHLYLYDGENYIYSTDGFLQNEMIDVGAMAHPVLTDINNDSRPDMIIGNYGNFIHGGYDANGFLLNKYRSKLIYYINDSNGDMLHFTQKTNDLGGLSVIDELGLAPAFGDLDGDGDQDMICGVKDGTLCYSECIAIDDDIPLFKEAELHYQDIDAGEYSTPCIFDIDQDGLLDIVAGNESGKLCYFKNTGTSISPDFHLVTNFWGEIDISSWGGHSTPSLYKDSSGHIHLLVGSAAGELFYYENIEEDINGAFSLSTALPALIGIEDLEADPDSVTSPYLADLDQNGKPELLIGTIRGGVLIKSLLSDPAIYSIDSKTVSAIRISPNPASTFISLSGLTKMDHYTITIYNALGELILKQDVRSTKIDISAFQNGIYLLQISTLNSEYSIKFVKQ